MSRTLYPVLQAPVLTSGQFLEGVSEDKWHQPWSEPVRFKILPALAIVLAAASGNFFNPLPIPNVDPAVVATTWFAPWRDPVRVPARLTTGAQRADFLVEAAPFGEDLSQMSKWFAPWRDPVRVPLRLGPGLNQDEALVKAAPFDETALVSKWFISFTDPVRLKPDIGAWHQRAEWSPPSNSGSLGESLVWFKNFVDPVRIPARLITGAQLFYASYIEPIPNYPWAPNYRLTVRRQDKRYIPIQGQAWTSPRKYPPVNEA
jgi:hypothetical protein